MLRIEYLNEDKYDDDYEYEEESEDGDYEE